jgi:hypothetical protein
MLRQRRGFPTHGGKLRRVTGLMTAQLLHRWYRELRRFPCFAAVKNYDIALHTRAADTAYGLCYPDMRRIYIRTDLSLIMMAKAMCHEMAHAAAPPAGDEDWHSPRWRAVMIAAGLDPTTHQAIPGSEFAEWIEHLEERSYVPQRAF